MRVARALEVLPELARLLRTGARPWSAVRELTRVATPDTEAAWVEASERLTVRQIQARVARRQPGSQPWETPDPRLTTHRLVLELSPDELADWQEAAEKVRREIGPAATNREVLRALVQNELGQRAASHPGYQTAVTVCAGCDRTWQRAGGELIEVAPEVGACARCDGEIVGVVEDPLGDESAHLGTPARALGGAATAPVGAPGRALVVDDHLATAHVGTPPGAHASDEDRATAHVGTPGRAPTDDDHPATAHVGASADAPDTADEPVLTTLLARLVRKRGARVLTRVLSALIGAPPKNVTPRLRTAVLTRDRGRCIVPGCRNFRFVDLHHHHPRAAGGPHSLENVLTLCTQHHRAIHDGVLAIEGSAASGWVVRHHSGVLYGASRARDLTSLAPPTSRPSG